MNESTTAATRTEPYCVLIEAPDFDVSAASEYGELIHLFQRVRYTAKVDDEFQKSLIDELEALNYNPEIDFLVVTGRTNIIAIAIASMMLHWSEISLLLYDPRTKQYIIKEIPDSES